MNRENGLFFKTAKVALSAHQLYTRQIKLHLAFYQFLLFSFSLQNEFLIYPSIKFICHHVLGSHYPRRLLF